MKWVIFQPFSNPVPVPVVDDDPALLTELSFDTKAEAYSKAVELTQVDIKYAEQDLVLKKSSLGMLQATLLHEKAKSQSKVGQ